MRELLEQLKRQAADAFEKAETREALEELRVKYLGKKGELTGILRGMGALSAEERPAVGQLANEVREFIEKTGSEKSAAIAKKERAAQLKAEDIDVTIPGKKFLQGGRHPLAIVMDELNDIFLGMGFSIEDYDEIVDDYHCFEALNIPKHHPARDMQDTYYLSTNQLLKTHTSAAQNAILKKYTPELEADRPIRVIFPGRCFRNEKIDACHENTFFQMEGVMVDKDISISNLIYFMKTMLSEVFQRDITVRLRPGFFPFVEPGFELDIQCLICGGDGCPSCKDSGWLELCPCGMIHPNVLTAAGLDPEKYTGFAFGLGLTRLAMMRYGIKDIRVFNSCNLKSLSQFENATFVEPEKEVK